MSIEVRCGACQHQIRVPDKYAGKKVKCPSCEATIAVPAGASQATPVQPTPAPAATRPKAAAPMPQAVAPTSQASAPGWFMKTADGQEYGPIDQAQLDRWITEGRIDDSCQLLREDWDQWYWAQEIYPQLAPATMESTASVSQSGFPQVGDGGGSAMSGGGYSSGEGDRFELSSSMNRFLAETRPWVMFLGILGFVCVGLGALGTLFSLAPMIFNGGSLPAKIKMIYGVMLIVNIGMLVLYFFAALHLVNYGSKISAYLARKSKRQLEGALASQKSFWKLVGITTLVVFVIYILLFFILFAIGSSIR